MEQLLWHLLAGTRGGVNRLRIVDELLREPANAQQLADRLAVDYRTARHHLAILVDNGLVVRPGGAGYGTHFTASRRLVAHLDTLEQIHAHLHLERGALKPARRPRADAAGGD